MRPEFIIDSSAYIAYLAGNEKIHKYILYAQKIFVPVIVVGELYYGYHKGSKFAYNQNILNRFIADTRVEVININMSVARAYGKIRATQQASGQVVAANDLWITALCTSMALPLLTCDSDFNKIKNLDLINL